MHTVYCVHCVLAVLLMHFDSLSIVSVCVECCVLCVLSIVLSTRAISHTVHIYVCMHVLVFVLLPKVNVTV